MRARARKVIGCSGLAFAASLASAAALRADASYAGNWQAGATSMEVAIQSWGKDCGPRPESTQTQGGGSVQIEQHGQVLTIRGSGREVRSDRCWSPNPAMRRASSSFAGGLWTTRCKTPANDPRTEVGTYTLKALSPDRLLYQDVSHFDWRLQDSTCVATITTTQTLLRLAPSGAAAATPAAAPEAPRCVPGPAARLSLRPRQVQLELGQRYCFRARVVDANNCPLEDAPVEFSLEHPRAIKASIHNGCFQAGQSSAEAEGSFKVVARHAKWRAVASVEVAAMTLPALLAKRMEVGALVADDEADSEAEPSAPPAPAASMTRVAAKAVSEPAAPDRRAFIFATCVLLALALAASGALLYRARKPARARTSRTADAPREAPSARIRRCPRCGSSYPESSAFCGVDGSALEPPE